MLSNIELSPETQAPKGTLGRLIWVAPSAILVAAVANIGLYLAAGALFPEVTGWPGAGLGQIIGATIVYLLIGAAVFAIVARRSAQPARHYLIAAAIGLLLSMALPISAGLGSGQPGMPPASTATIVTLSLMHVVSFAISVPMFIRLALA